MQNDKEVIDKLIKILDCLAEEFHNYFLNDPNETLSFEDLAVSMVMARDKLREAIEANEVKNENT